MRGNPTGPEVAGTAVLLDQAGTAKVGGLMAKRYGLMYHALTLRQKFSRGAGSVGIEISVGQQDSPPAPRPLQPSDQSPCVPVGVVTIRDPNATILGHTRVMVTVCRHRR